MLTAWLIANKTLLFGVGAGFFILTVSKLPDPRKFEGKWYYALYYAAFVVANWLSVGAWNRFGFKGFSLPFTVSPKLSETPHPLAPTFTKPEFIKFDEEVE